MLGLSKFSIAIGNLFKKPATRMYPQQKREFYANTRGNLCIEIDKCTFCGFCQRRCPTHAITVNRTESEWTIDRLKCIACDNCSEVCPGSRSIKL